MSTKALVIPFYNSSGYLSYWESISQRLRKIFDIVVFVDDCSSSLHYDLLESFALESGFVLLTNNSNKGPLVSRLIGAEYSSCYDFVMFMDSDDEFDIGFEGRMNYNQKSFDLISFGVIKKHENFERRIEYHDTRDIGLENNPAMFGRFFRSSILIPLLKEFCKSFGDLRFAEDLGFMLYFSMHDVRTCTMNDICTVHIKRRLSLSERLIYNSKETNKPIILVAKIGINKLKKEVKLIYLFNLLERRKSIIVDLKFDIIVIAFLILKYGAWSNLKTLVTIMYNRFFRK